MIPHSASLLNILTSTLNPDNGLRCAPFFGSIGFDTSFKLKQQGLQPVSLYSPYVASNPPTIHNYRSGPVVSLLHDIAGHLYLANFVRKNQHQFIFEYLLPKVMQHLNIDINQVTSGDSEYMGLFALMDQVTQLMRGEPNKNVDPDKWFIECFKTNALGINKGMGKNTQDIFTAIYADRELIKDNYQLDIEDLVKHPLFGPIGIDLLECVTNNRSMLHN